MPITSVNRVKTIVIPLSTNSGSSIVPIYQRSGLTLGSDFLPGYKVISYNCFVKNLKAFASIGSLPEIPLPDFQLEDSQTAKLYKTLDIEWKSPRKQLNLYISNSEVNEGGLGWSIVGSVSLLNPSGYPFRVYKLMDLYTDNLAIELGDNSNLGVGCVEAGTGLLANNDVITIHGSYVEEIFVQYDERVAYSTSLPPSGLPGSIPSSSSSPSSSAPSSASSAILWNGITTVTWNNLTLENWQSITR